MYDGIGSWKRRPIRASKKTYMPSHKRWGKITVTKMPVPEGQITSSQLWSTPEVIEEPEEEVAEEKPKSRKKKVEVNEEILSNKI
jgi:hypothetical protein